MKTELNSQNSVVSYSTINTLHFKEQKVKKAISNNSFRLAMKTSSSPFWDWNLETNTIFYSSKSFKKIKQEQKEAFINNGHWNKIMQADDLKKCFAEIQNHFENKNTSYKKLHSFVNSSAKSKWFLIKAKVIKRSKNGKPTRIRAIHTDITAQKKLELKQEQTIKLYKEHNNRLLNFSHIVSHNLNSYSGNIKMILDIMDSEKKALTNTEHLNLLRTVSNHLNETISHLSQIVNVQNNLDVIKKPLNLNSYLEKNNQIINNYGFENKITIINKVPEGSIVNFNSAYLTSILLNFSTNAIKYAHPDRFPIITFDFFIENKKKVLTVNDNGLGIDLEKHGDSLFGMYKTFHENENANGIGLYITKNQIESMNGQISIESVVEKGTTFKIIFSD